MIVLLHLFPSTTSGRILPAQAHLSFEAESIIYFMVNAQVKSTVIRKLFPLPS